MEIGEEEERIVTGHCEMGESVDILIWNFVSNCYLYNLDQYYNFAEMGSSCSFNIHTHKGATESKGIQWDWRISNWEITLIYPYFISLNFKIKISS